MDGRTSVRGRLSETLPKLDTVLATAIGTVADGVDDCRVELLKEVQDLRDDIGSTRRVLWAVFTSFATLSVGIMALILQVR
jgi:hypothetical protein